MAGFTIPGQRYQDPTTGHWGTAEEHAERKRKEALDASDRDRNLAALRPPVGGAPPASGAPAPVGPASAGGDDFRRLLEQNRTAGLADQTERDRLALLDKYKREGEDRARMDARQTERRQRKAKEADRASMIALFDKTNSTIPPRVATPGNGSAPSSVAAGSSVEDPRTVAFARAKDQAGKIARASLTSIAEQVANRGISGSGIEAMQSAGAIGNAAEPLQNLTANQMASDFNRAGQVEDMRYQGDIAQRGQDLNQRQSYLALLRSLY